MLISINALSEGMWWCPLINAQFVLRRLSLASYPGLLTPVFVACSTNTGEGLVKLSHMVWGTWMLHVDNKQLCMFSSMYKCIKLPPQSVYSCVSVLVWEWTIGWVWGARLWIPLQPSWFSVFGKRWGGSLEASYECPNSYCVPRMKEHASPDFLYKNKRWGCVLGY